MPAPKVQPRTTRHESLGSVEGGDPPLEPERPYIVSSYFRGLLGYLRSRAVPLEPVLDVMGLTEEELGDPDRRIDHSLQTEIFRVAEQLTEDPNVGLHAGEATQLMHFGIIGMLTLTCKSVRELVDLHSRFQGLITNGATVRYVALGDELVGEVSSVDGPESRHTVEYNTTSHLTVARLMVGFDFSPARIDVPYEKPADTSEQERVFGCPVRYGCERQRVCFPLGLLELPLLVADSGSRGVLEIEARKRLAALSAPPREEKAGLAALKQLVGRGLLGGPPSLEEAAATLGVSARTLQRRLEAQRITYRDVVDFARKEMADRYMRADDLSQVEVALLIGFSDQSAFHRAFRRWFGKTPGEYRAQLRRR